MYSKFYNMRTIGLVLLIGIIFASCSNPTPFLVKRIVDEQTIELEDGTMVKLIGVNRSSNKYIQALNGRLNNYVLLYDENYDPIKEIDQASLLAYVYDQEGNCINNYADSIGSSSGGEGVSDNTLDQAKPPSGGTVSSDTGLKARISGKQIEALPANSLSELYEKNKYSVFLIAVPRTKTTYAQGTGFFITSSGIGVSNFHVFEGSKQNEAIIKTIDNHQYGIKRIIKSDKELDYIVFEVENDHSDFPYLKLAESQPVIGEDVFAIGNPQGLEHTLSKGIVSSYREYDKRIQTTTEITHGSSGGPLFNMKGFVVGITTSGVGEANLNFAMNIQKLGIKELIEK